MNLCQSVGLFLRNLRNLRFFLDRLNSYVAAIKKPLRRAKQSVEAISRKAVKGEPHHPCRNFTRLGRWCQTRCRAPMVYFSRNYDRGGGLCPKSVLEIV